MPSVELTKERWRSTTSHVPDFVEGCCELLAECSVESGKLYAVYKDWCLTKSIPPIGQQQLTMQLHKLGVTPHKGAKGARLLSGIRLLDAVIGLGNGDASTGGAGGGASEGGAGGAPSRHNLEEIQHKILPGAAEVDEQGN